MSNLPGNPHYKPILESISDFGEYTISAEGLTDATIVWQGLADQAQATLALAYEQRTANLIAYVEKIDDQTLMAERCSEIAHRLGLKTSREMRAEK